MLGGPLLIKGPTGQSYYLRITRPSLKAAVIWLEEKKMRERWFCNIRFDEGVTYCRSDKNPFATMPHTLLGIIQDAFDAASDSKKEGTSTSFELKSVSAYYMELSISFTVGKVWCSWMFPMSPDDPMTIVVRKDGRALQ